MKAPIIWLGGLLLIFIAKGMLLEAGMVAVLAMVVLWNLASDKEKKDMEQFKKDHNF